MPGRGRAGQPLARAPGQVIKDRYHDGATIRWCKPQILPADRAAVDKLLGSNCPFLVTYPPGYHAAFDAYIRSLDLAAHGAKIMVWIRPERGNDWQQIDYRELTPQRETYGPAWANVVAALYRGPDDLWDI